MKSIIEYEYNLKVNDIKIDNNKYYVITEEEYFCFEKTDYNEDFLELINKSKMFYQIKKNKKGAYLTIINKEKYILYKLDSKKIIMNNLILNNNGRNWKELWIKKVERLSKHSYCTELEEYFDYYIGLAECAISAWNKVDKSKIKYSICRKRMSNDIKNPNNAIIDIRERDISELIKEELFNNKKVELEQYISFIKKNELNIELIYCRLLFPTYYLDILEKYIINKKYDNYKMEKIINKRKEYEYLLNSFGKMKKNLDH